MDGGTGRVEVLGSRMAYVEAGAGRPVLLLHGNPTSSFLWRNVIPHLAPLARVVAVDLIGMGVSDRPAALGYTLGDHARHLDGFVAALGLADLALVGHDWGGVLALRHARLNEGAVRGVALMETHLPPAMPAPSLAAMGEGGAMFARLRRPGEGERLVLEENLFLEVVLPRLGVVRPLDEATLAAYRAPFPTPASRRPILAWARQVPIAGEPADVAATMEANAAWLAATAVPRLLLHAEPGALVTPAVVAHLAASVPGLETRDLGPGTHFLPEDHPDAIGRALAGWLRRI